MSTRTLERPLGESEPGPKPERARIANPADRVYAGSLVVLGGVVLVVAGLIVVQLADLSRPVFGAVGLGHFVAGSDWDPVSGSFGALPFIYGTLVTSAVAIVVAVPVGVGLAVFLAEMSPPSFRSPISFAVETLAGIPSVVYGLWGLFVLVPILRDDVEPVLSRTLGPVPLLGALFRGPPIGLGYLAAGVILAIMILPTVASVSLEVLRTVPASLREGALALGATRWEAVRLASLPYARTGILGAVLLGLGRALGETMAVTMVIGNQPEIHASLLSPGYSLPSVIANEFAEAVTPVHVGALAGLALILLGLAVVLNALARLLVGRTTGKA